MTRVLDTIQKFKDNNHWTPRVIHELTRHIITEGANDAIDNMMGANRPYNIEDMSNIFGMVYPNTLAVLRAMGCSFVHGISDIENYRYGPDIEVRGHQIQDILFRKLQSHDLNKLMVAEELYHTRCTKLIQTNKPAKRPTGTMAIRNYLRNTPKTTLTDFFCKAKKVIVGEWELRDFTKHTGVGGHSAAIIVAALTYNGNHYRWGSYGSHKLNKTRYYVVGFVENHNSSGKYTRYLADFVLCNEIIRSFRFKTEAERTWYLSESYPFPHGQFGSYIYHDRITLFNRNFKRVYDTYANFIPEKIK